MGCLDTLNNVLERLEVDFFKAVVLGLELLSLLLVHLDDGFVVLKTVVQIVFALLVEVANTKIFPHHFKSLQVLFLLVSVSQLTSNEIRTFFESVRNDLHFGVLAEENCPFDVAVEFSADSEVRVRFVGEGRFLFSKFCLLHLDKRQVEVFDIGAFQLVHKFVEIGQVKLNIDVVGGAVTTENSNESFNTFNKGLIVFEFQVLEKLGVLFLTEVNKDIVELGKTLVSHAGLAFLIRSLLVHLGLKVANQLSLLSNVLINTQLSFLEFSELA